MQIVTSFLGDLQIVRISGVVNSHAAGRLGDVLVAAIADGRKKLIVDVSNVVAMTHAGADGLVVAAKMLEAGRGAMRICGARPPVAAALTGLGFDHLVKLDPTIGESMMALAPDVGVAVIRDYAAWMLHQPVPAARAA